MKKYKSEMRKAIYQDAKLLYKSGLMTDEEMRHFDEACLIKPPAAPVPRVSTQKPSSPIPSGAPVYASGK